MMNKFEKFGSKTFPQEIEWKIQSFAKNKPSALVVPYVKKMSAVSRLDKCFGVDGWSNSMKREAEGFICSITIDGLTKTDAGSDSEHDAFKGGASDSFKRAAKLWGFGRDLDNYPPIWIEIDSPNQKYAKIQDAQRKELDKISSAMRTGEEIKEFYYLKK